MTIQVIRKEEQEVIVSVDVDRENVVGIVKDGYVVIVDGNEIKEG